MLFKQFTASLALVATAIAIPAGEIHELLERQSVGSMCAHMSGGIHVIAVGGGGLALGGNPKEYGYLGTLASNITSAIPGSTSVSVPYDKVYTKTNRSAIPNGMLNLEKYIIQYNYYCPQTKIALIGYSSGAVIQMSVMCQNHLPSTFAGNPIIAAVMYGDETRNAGESYDLGTCPEGLGISPRASGSCGAFIPYIQSYCDENDPFCCLPNGSDPNIHFVYPNEYDAIATQFVVNQAKTFGL